jgi:HPt (histidine-containing phosphotransfer) domain-containing protein
MNIMRPDLANEPLLDPVQIEMLREAMGPEDLGSMLAELPLHALQTRGAIEAALASEDLDQARREAHVLKGFASSFGAARLAAIAREMELDSPSITALRQCMPALIDIIEKTTAALAELTMTVVAGS